MEEEQLKIFAGKTAKIQLTSLTERLQSTVKKKAGVSWTLFPGGVSAPFFPGTWIIPACLHIVLSLVLAQKNSAQPCSETDQEPIQAEINPAQIIVGSNSDQFPSHKQREG